MEILHSTWQVFVLILTVGALLGFVGGLFGIGGGIIAIPVLVYFFHMSQALAQGTAIIMILPNVMMSFWQYQQRNNIPLKTAFLTAGIAAVTTYPAARLSVNLDSHVLKTLFAVFLLFLTTYLFVTNFKKLSTQKSTPRFQEKYLPLVGVIGGLFAGFFSVGAGIVATPIFVRYFGKRQAVAQGLALALVVPGAIVALMTYTHAHQVDWDVGIPLALGGLTSISWGVALAHQLPERQLKLFFSVLLMLTAVQMLF